MIVEYTINTATTTGGLSSAVDADIREGWEPFGSMVIESYEGTVWYHQPMVRRSPTEESSKA